MPGVNPAARPISTARRRRLRDDRPGTPGTAAGRSGPRDVTSSVCWIESRVSTPQPRHTGGNGSRVSRMRSQPPGLSRRQRHRCRHGAASPLTEITRPSPELPAEVQEQLAQFDELDFVQIGKCHLSIGRAGDAVWS